MKPDWLSIAYLGIMISGAAVFAALEKDTLAFSLVTAALAAPVATKVMKKKEAKKNAAQEGEK